MPLELRPLELADFDSLSAYDAALGDTTTPMALHAWPEPATAADKAARVAWSVSIQRTAFLNNYTTRFVKVVDTDRPEHVAAYARFQRYANNEELAFASGFVPGKPAAGDQSTPWPQEVNASLVRTMLGGLLEARRDWQGDAPHWVLSLLFTREPDRGKGAGGMLVRWGVEQAINDGMPIYLEAEPGAVSLYKRCGFEDLGLLSIDLSAHGREPWVLTKMAANRRL